MSAVRCVWAIFERLVHRAYGDPIRVLLDLIRPDRHSKTGVDGLVHSVDSLLIFPVDF